jgi:hypothetical protein
VEGEPYLLAADLVDPTTVVAFEPTPEGIRLAPDRRVLLIREQLHEIALEWEVQRENLEAATLGLRQETVEVSEPSGRSQVFETAGRFFFQGRDLLFLKVPEDQSRAFPVEVRDHGRLEPVTDEVLLDALRAHMNGLAGPAPAPSQEPGA